MFKIGDRVAVYSRQYVRGTRRPGFKGKFTFRFLRNGVLLAKNDRRAWGHLPAWTQEDIDRHLNCGHVGLMNATGPAVGGDLTEGNNPVLLDNGDVVWVYATQIRKPR